MAAKRNTRKSHPSRKPASSVPEEERKEAERTGALVRQKLLEIMDLQADIHALFRGRHPTPFGSGRWKNARLEKLQRAVLIAAVQIESITPTRFEPNPNAEQRHFGDEGPKAWFAVIRREE